MIGRRHRLVQRCHINCPQSGISTSGLCLDVLCTTPCSAPRSLPPLTPNQVDEEVGAAIRESGIPRSELFITSKFWPHFAAPENVELCLDQVLKKTGLEYVDLFLAHWPCAFKPISREALEKAVTGPNVSKTEKGILLQPGTDDPVIDWTHTSANLATQAGISPSWH